MKTLKNIGFVIVFALPILVTAELLARWKGLRPGYLNEGITKVDSLTCNPEHYTDTNGIWRHCLLPQVNGVNNEGFIWPNNYTTEIADSLKQLGKKLVLVIGDSYVEGLSTGNMAESFTGLLAKEDPYAIFNLGMGGSDPKQYEMVAAKYIPLLKPHIVIVCFFTGNDVVYAERETKPYRPLLYETNAGSFLADPSVVVPGIAQAYATEYDAYINTLNTLSLVGTNARWYHQLIASSSFATTLYYRFNPVLDNLMKKNGTPYSGVHFRRIDSVCQSNDAKLLVVAAPSIKHVTGQQERYKNLCREVLDGTPYHTVNITDYGIEDFYSLNNDHFTVSGNRKFFLFLKDLLAKSN